MESSADRPGQCGSSGGDVSTQGHWRPTPIFLGVTSLSVGIVIRWKKHKGTTRLSAAQKSVSMTTPVSKLASHFCHRSWHKVSHHYFFFSPPSSFCCFEFDFFLPPVELSCAITAPIILLQLRLLLSLIFLSLIAIYFPKLHPWVKIGNISGENDCVLSSFFLFFLFFFQRRESGSRLEISPLHHWVGIMNTTVVMQTFVVHHAGLCNPWDVLERFIRSSLFICLPGGASYSSKDA